MMDAQLIFNLLFTLLELLIIIFFCYLFYLIIKSLRKYIKSKPIRTEKKITTKKISEQLKNTRLQKKMTQEFVAETLGISRQTLYKWEKGISEPSMSNLVELSKLYKINLEELIESIDK